MFKTQKDIWEHLLVEGNKIHKSGISSTVWLEKGFLVDKDGRRYYSFDKPSDWEPYIEPAWEDKLDDTEENAVWCWVSDLVEKPSLKDHGNLRLVKGTKEVGCKYQGSKNNWSYATPLNGRRQANSLP